MKIFITVLFSSLILGGFVYAGIKERQNIIDERAREEYIGKRKMDCYEILERERNRENEEHNSVTGVEYYPPVSGVLNDKDLDDVCRIEYAYKVSRPDGTTGIEAVYKNY